MMTRSRCRTRTALAALLLAGCGSWGRPGKNPEPSQGETLTQILDLNAVYRRLGRLTAGAPVPFVADLAFFGGPGDSTVTVVGISLENRALSFQRDGDAFVARYRVEVTASPTAGGTAVRRGKDQVVRVATFPETQRSDESILFQEGFNLAPGEWRVALTLSDGSGGRTSKAEGAYRVPAFGPGTRSPPRLTYQARARGERSAPVAVILNPRGTLAYGGDTASAYVEAYQLAGPTAVPVILRDSRDSVFIQDTLRFAGGREVESAVIRFAPDSAPLGELSIVVGSPPQADSTIAIVSFSQGWVVTNFEDMVALLRYFPGSPALDSLRKAAPEQRDRLWRAFWRASDPNTATPNNEALDRYFERVAIANLRYRGEGIPGWRTDRGEVLIRLGEPDEVFDASPASEGRLIRWAYTPYQLALYFVDETGFGRFRLTPASRVELERVAARLTRLGE
jgi:GWxTD domain-containing protein